MHYDFFLTILHIQRTGSYDYFSAAEIVGFAFAALCGVLVIAGVVTAAVCYGMRSNQAKHSTVLATYGAPAAGVGTPGATKAPSSSASRSRSGSRVRANSGAAPHGPSSRSRRSSTAVHATNAERSKSASHRSRRNTDFNTITI